VKSAIKVLTSILVLVAIISYGSFYFISKSLEASHLSRIRSLAQNYSIELTNLSSNNGTITVAGIAKSLIEKSLFVSAVDNSSSYFKNSFSLSVDDFQKSEEPQKNIVVDNNAHPLKEHEIARVHLFFHFEQAKLKSGEESKLSKILEYIKDNPNDLLYVSGHTDVTGTISVNENLGLRRAEMLAKKLKELGVPKDRIIVENHADKLPLSKNGTKLGREINRRVDLIIKRKI
jgi:outer membrane protein OmpA-like peptidoglycan-associated protein